jgi:DNA-binding NtrC family response regulator
MTLEEAYIRRKQENMALKRENASLSATVEALRKGTYSNPEKIAHLKKISELTRKLQEQERIKERYKTLYEKEKDNTYDLYGKIYTLEETIQSLQWQVDCLEGKSSR